MLSVAIRIAQRIGIHSESALAKCTPLEAEMGRRLWWSLILFDTRISELACYKTTTLAPTWDCAIPLNVSDSDLRPEMKEPPAVQGKSSEALFAVVRSELGEFIRHTMFHLHLTNPVLKPLAKNVQRGSILEASELVALEKMIEDKYLKLCDPENPLHFMTIWTTRAYLAKCRLVEYHSRYSNSPVHQREVEHDAAFSHALSMLECDTEIVTSPLTRGFLWLVHLYFPFPAYIHLVQDLRRRTDTRAAEQAWEIMSANYMARLAYPCIDDSPFFKIFARIVLDAWEAREAAFKQSGEPMMTPRIVSIIRDKVAQMANNTQSPGTEQPNGVTAMGMDDFTMSIPMGLDSHGLLYNTEAQDLYMGTGPALYSRITGQAPLDVDVDDLDWAAMDWGFVNVPTGEAP
jgi:hypothetical protein